MHWLANIYISDTSACVDIIWSIQSTLSLSGTHDDLVFYVWPILQTLGQFEVWQSETVDSTMTGGLKVDSEGTELIAGNIKTIYIYILKAKLQNT